MAVSQNEPQEAVPPSSPKRGFAAGRPVAPRKTPATMRRRAASRTNFSRLMNGALAAAVFCDPPYNLRVSSIGGRGRNRASRICIRLRRNAPGAISDDFFPKRSATAFGVSADGAVHFVCMDWRHIGDLIDVGRELYGTMLNLVVWNKSNAGQGSFYRSQHELIGVFRVGEQSAPETMSNSAGSAAIAPTSGPTRASTRSVEGRMEALAVHPTVKPTALVADALLDCTARGDVVLDQFAGSGTIILAAEKVGRVAYGLEYRAAICRCRHPALAATDQTRSDIRGRWAKL